MYNLMTNKVNLDWKTLFTLSESKTRGHRYKVTKKKASRNVTMNAFSNRVINDWNGLPSGVVSVVSTNAFKNRLDKFWGKDMLDVYE